MTKLGPLASLALGRSPYDDVVPGQGEDDPRAPVQSYDERGRPVNVETKRINRDIVRSHNEVMHVIGVAEPDSGFWTAEAEAARRLAQQQHEDRVGRQLMVMGRIMGISGGWGINALRSRILLYREYSHVHFHQLLSFESRRHPASNIFTTGLPVFLVSHSLRQMATRYGWLRNAPWKRALMLYVRQHLQVFLCLQRMNIIAPSPWFPSLSYFVPFSAASPIGRPPPLPSSLSLTGLLSWFAHTLVGIAPLAVFYGYSRLWRTVTQFLYREIYMNMPAPTNFGWSRMSLAEFEFGHASPPYAALPEDDATAAGAQAATIREQHQNWSRPEETQDVQPTQPPQQQEATSRTATPPPPDTADTERPRRNTVSSRGDDGYGSEEEEYELSATLISFDVEATESADAPSNPWSAELRQSTTQVSDSNGNGHGNGNGSNGNETRAAGAIREGYDDGMGMAQDEEGGGDRTHDPDNDVMDLDDPDQDHHDHSHHNNDLDHHHRRRNQRIYADNMLTRLPSIIATDVLTGVASSLLLAPYEALVVRLAALAYRRRHGLAVDDLHPVGLVSLALGTGGLSWTAVGNVLGVALAQLLVESACWLVTTGLAMLYRDSEPEWTFWQVVERKWRGRE